MSWTRETFAAWLDRYGAAWESKDTAGFAALFTDDCAYYWTPLDPPYVGPAAIAGAFGSAVSTQEAIDFNASIVSVDAQNGVARWTCTFTRQPEGHGVYLNGILVARADAGAYATGGVRCAEFREWWHREEPSSQVKP
jgi:hypothetical protein